MQQELTEDTEKTKRNPAFASIKLKINNLGSVVNTKNKLSFQRINEELNIYYVAATRAKNAIQLADLNLSYTYNENDETTTHVRSRFISKRADNKKSKELQEEWLKNNRAKKII